MRCARDGAARQDRLELRARLDTLHSADVGCGQRQVSDRQALAALGSASVDDGAAGPCFHADEKTMCPRAAGFGGLVSTFHANSFGLVLRNARVSGSAALKLPHFSCKPRDHVKD